MHLEALCLGAGVGWGVSPARSRICESMCDGRCWAQRRASGSFRTLSWPLQGLPYPGRRGRSSSGLGPGTSRLGWGWASCWREQRGIASWDGREAHLHRRTEAETTRLPLAPVPGGALLSVCSFSMLGNRFPQTYNTVVCLVWGFFALMS